MVNEDPLYGASAPYYAGGGDEKDPFLSKDQPQYDTPQYGQMNTYAQDLEYGQGQPTVVYWYTAGLPVGHTDNNRFIAKVLSVVLLQLSVTVAICAPILSSQSAVNTFQNPDNWWIQLVGVLGALVFLVLCALLRHVQGLNWLMLFLFTGSLSVTVASVVACYAVIVVLEAFLITICTVFILLLVTLVAKVDLRLFASVVIVSLSFVLWWALFVFVFTPMYCVCDLTSGYCLCSASPFWSQFWTTVGILLFLAYLMFDLSRLQHTCQHHEWMLAAINIYVDVVMLFLILLGARK